MKKARKAVRHVKKKIITRLGKKLHRCGGGFEGEVIKAKGIIFCGFCGKEFKGIK